MIQCPNSYASFVCCSESEDEPETESDEEIVDDVQPRPQTSRESRYEGNTNLS